MFYCLRNVLVFQIGESNAMTIASAIEHNQVTVFVLNITGSDVSHVRHVVAAVDRNIRDSVILLSKGAQSSVINRARIALWTMCVSASQIFGPNPCTLLLVTAVLCVMRLMYWVQKQRIPPFRSKPSV